VLQRLVAAGNTVVVVEHNLDVIAEADWIIDLGPEGGAAGGHLVACGSPEDIIQPRPTPAVTDGIAADGPVRSHTARVLAAFLRERHA
jgi:excinuclease ABC subunit A